ncbi:antitoxin Xre/MbcA/ParS toxin-binding domain-containing protein [Defluviimonas salinarum]|uniref:antitoxin Xre/MbcA/ParS toxin-binding domain-containing protein n=1 Tax=Defluviimonas salinarum TaxID=2992147 RepID=UPI00223224DD|nr:antitoxin Xre/MbcA/ParS toxin-binding domain-containing protein [Defluviimonas salinarum]
MKTQGGALTPMQLLDLVERGLPESALSKLAEVIGCTPAAIVASAGPKATRALRKNDGTFDPALGTVVIRLAAVFSLALEVWDDKEDARAFLHRPHPMLEGRSPFDVALRSEIGAAIVDEILDRLRHGSAT